MQGFTRKINLVLAVVAIALAVACASQESRQTADKPRSEEYAQKTDYDAAVVNGRAIIKDEIQLGELAKMPELRQQASNAEGVDRYAKSKGLSPNPTAAPQSMALGLDSSLYYAGARGGMIAGESELPSGEGFNREAYNPIDENGFLTVMDQPLSTFSIDVDTASYANVRRFLQSGQRPPVDAIRLEELINYFSYDYGEPTGDDPFAIDVEVTACPWNDAHRLARIGLAGRKIPSANRPDANLVFLLDVSGSMNSANKLPLVKKAMKMLADNLNASDRVAIVVYAGASGLVLPSTQASDSQSILAAIDNLKSGGSTNGGAGIELAYKTATENFITGGVNRVILCTDGDFNVGTTDQGSLIRLIEEKAKSKVFLTVLGFGMGNLNDGTLEQLADKGNGQYGYIDTEAEARKMFVEQIGGTLVTIAKDVKVQVEFNPAVVSEYRLIGYENRLMAAQDFNDDTKDAGEIGAGHHVTALYEITPLSKDELGMPKVDPLKYQTERQVADAAYGGEMMTVKLRYKAPDGDVSKLIERPVNDNGGSLATASENTRFAAAVAAFGMILRGSELAGSATPDSVVALAEGALGDDPNGYRAGFLELVNQARVVGFAAETSDKDLAVAE